MATAPEASTAEMVQSTVFRTPPRAGGDGGGAGGAADVGEIGESEEGDSEPDLDEMLAGLDLEGGASSDGGSEP